MARALNLSRGERLRTVCHSKSRRIQQVDLLFKRTALTVTHSERLVLRNVFVFTVCCYLTSDGRKRVKVKWDSAHFKNDASFIVRHFGVNTLSAARLSYYSVHRDICIHTEALTRMILLMRHARSFCTSK